MEYIVAAPTVPHAHLVAGCQGDGLHRLAHAHLICQQDAALPGQAVTHARPLERQQAGPEPRQQPAEGSLCLRWGYTSHGCTPAWRSASPSSWLLRELHEMPG